MADIPGHVPESVVHDFDIYRDALFGEDLHASFETLHRDAPDVFWTPRNGGHWVVTRYSDILDVVRDPVHFSVREQQIPRVENPPRFIPLSLDPPENIPYRQALMPFFAPKTVREMEPRIRQFATGFIDAVLEQGDCEFVEEISSRFPVSVFMELMGMPLEKLHEFRETADLYLKAQQTGEMQVHVSEIIRLMTELLVMRQAAPKDDLISKMTQFDIDGRRITLEELQSICLILFLGGMDTVTNVTSYLFRHLAADPKLQARLAREPEKIPDFVEEGLRSFGVVNTPRIVARDVSRFGVDFREGEMVLCLLPLGGRDDRRTDDPNAFNIDRGKFEHTTFASGPHLCLGHNLARFEMRVLVEAWLKRIPQFRLKAGARPKHRLGLVMALEELRLEWDR